jgi:hypothetical protein
MTDLKVLRLVGDVSDWQYIAEAWAAVLEPAPQAKDETGEAYARRCADLAKAAEDARQDYGDAAFKVRVLDDRTLAEVDELLRLRAIAADEAKAADDAAEADGATPEQRRAAVRLGRAAFEAEVDADRMAIKAALHSLQGFEHEGEVNAATVDALCVSPYRWIVAYICRSYQRATGAGRAGFFTRAPTG